MILFLKLDASEKEVEKVKEKVAALGCTPHLIYGTEKLAIALTGPTTSLDEEEFLLLDSVQEVLRISKKYKLVSREAKREDSIIKIDGVEIGGDNLTMIAGPCSIESRQQLFDIAGALKEMGIRLFRAGAYKPRTSPYAFQGLKEKGLEYLSDIKKELGMLIVTEAKDTETLGLVAEVSDIIQIGARNMQNFSLLEKAGCLQKPVLLKRGLAASIEDLLMSAEYILAQGNFDVILCERGIRTFETYTRNTLDLNAVPVIKKLSHLPVFVDPSHGIGIWDKVPAMSMGAVACGADGLIIEVHNKPDEALSDGFQSLTPKNFEKLLTKLSQLAPIVDKKFVRGFQEAH
ncbi:MAG: 3-deoxy-7-phosphoheptulonate synthase [Bacteroidota bacterium]|jgi:3-deoxy-7-phosphoheptulonate synthase|nr:3-deoxy-7-phosphoheptulonate synthase [Ignavibacteria bacterium]HEX2962251.1 3-deoxy-7-phosphoheptulonate synthase [Ignavibacteriales bacterium]MCU7500073.1 3-deoxy-7-phosphoheptulonate synthase [Ignavibacteria bacterium]MCU7513410.1 3-deoxy-7-phosphoheptulonate synthase [Ignavibacteria bacterium]MCU7522181.1 3-deoxy-7-phosphoheptulonate synthase [Ignavibacteria bacterium]